MIKSDLLDAEINGVFSIDKVPSYFARYLQDEFPLFAHQIGIVSTDTTNTPHEFRYAVNIKDIHKKHGKIKLKSFPFFDSKAKHYYKMVKSIKTIDLLNYMPYVKSEVKEIISQELNWRDYGGKHYESVFTRFYQGYILPQKFGIDKRKAHLSNLICSGQISKQQALEELKSPIYPSDVFETDKEFVLKKLGFSENEFEAYLKRPRREHTEFRTEQSLYENYPILKPLKPIGNLLKKMLKG